MQQTLRLRPSFRIDNGNNGRFTVIFTENTSSALTFNSVKADDISDNLTIRPALVNGNSPEFANFPITAISEEQRKQSLALVLRIENGVVLGFKPSLSAREKEQHRDLVIPSRVWGQSITSIGAKAFENSGLTGLTIPNSITSIGVGAFAVNLITSVTIPNSVTAIGASAFKDNEIRSLTIPSSVTSIEDGVFAKNQLTELNIPNSVTSIGASAFADNQLTKVTIGENVKIDSNAFYSCPAPSGSADIKKLLLRVVI